MKKGVILAIASPTIIRVGVANDILTLLDVWSLRRVSRACAAAMRVYDERKEYPFFERLLSLFDGFCRERAREFLLLAMREHGCVIAGSAALWVASATHEMWMPNDVNVVAHGRYRNALRFVSPNPNSLVDAHVALRDWITAQRISLGLFCETSICRIKLHVGFHDEATPVQHINGTYDFSLCKTRLVWHEKLGRVTLECPSVLELEKRSITINYNGVPRSTTYDLWQIYISRGFVFKNDEKVIEWGARRRSWVRHVVSGL